MTDSSSKASGGSFLLNSCGASPSFKPEDFTSELRELAETTRRFSCERVLVASDRIESSEAGLVETLMREAGGLGLFAAEVPNEYGGMGLGAVEAATIAENISHQGSFVVSFLCHCGIGMHPLLAFGTEEQKKKYLPGMISGERIGAFALTETEAGSDALAVRARATLSPDGKHYVLNGEKLYCTNAAHAALFTVFAKSDEGLAAFLVERDKTPGFSVGSEEKKMGIHGSSTASVILSEAKIPAENLLGEPGRGHRVAFTTLNTGRMKLGAACVGSAKRLIAEMAEQANSRRQFGRPIGSFELVRQKIARSFARLFLSESLVYRLAGDFDSRPDAAAEFSAEAAIAKVYCSEAVAFVADEAVALFGGSGYIKGILPEKVYRDCRIDRIFEGTNEICRLYVASSLMKRAASGKLPLMQRLGEILSELKSGFPKSDPGVPLADMVDRVEEMKRLCIYLAGVTLREFGEGISKRQAALEAVANLAAEAYAFDSGVARAICIDASGDSDRAEIVSNLCRASLVERMPVLIAQTRQALINTAGNDEAKFAPYLKALSRLAEMPAFDTDAAWDRVAEHVLEGEDRG